MLYGEAVVRYALGGDGRGKVDEAEAGCRLGGLNHLVAGHVHAGLDVGEGAEERHRLYAGGAVELTLKRHVQLAAVLAKLLASGFLLDGFGEA